MNICVAMCRSRGTVGDLAEEKFFFSIVVT